MCVMGKMKVTLLGGFIVFRLLDTGAYIQFTGDFTISTWT